MKKKIKYIYTVGLLLVCMGLAACKDNAESTINSSITTTTSSTASSMDFSSSDSHSISSATSDGLEAKRALFISQINAYFRVGTALVDFSEANKAAINELKTAAVTAINQAEFQEIDGIFNTAKTSIDEIKTMAEETNESLSLAKTEAITEINTYFRSGTALVDFSESNKLMIAEIKANTITTITNATTISSINTAVITAKISIDEIKTMAEESIYTTLEPVYEKISKLKVNDKGTIVGEEVIVILTCIARIDQSLLLFTDGNRIIKIHGAKEEKLWNYVTVGSVYQIKGKIGYYLYQPQITEVTNKDITRNTDVLAVTSITPKEVTIQTLLNMPRSDSSLYGYLLKITSYINLDVRNSSNNRFVLTETQAGTKTSFGTYNGLYVQNSKDLLYYSTLDDYFIDDYYKDSIEVTVYVTLYDVFKEDSKDFWRVYLFEDLLT